MWFTLPGFEELGYLDVVLLFVVVRPKLGLFAQLFDTLFCAQRTLLFGVCRSFGRHPYGGGAILLGWDGGSSERGFLRELVVASFTHNAGAPSAVLFGWRGRWFERLTNDRGFVRAILSCWDCCFDLELFLNFVFSVDFTESGSFLVVFYLFFPSATNKAVLTIGPWGAPMVYRIHGGFRVARAIEADGDSSGCTSWKWWLVCDLSGFESSEKGALARNGS